MQRYIYFVTGGFYIANEVKSEYSGALPISSVEWCEDVLLLSVGKISCTAAVDTLRPSLRFQIFPERPGVVQVCTKLTHTGKSVYLPRC